MELLADNMTEESTKYVNIKPLKELVSKELPPSSMARRIILQENDSITATSFLEKLKVWFQLINEEREAV
ncbi:MAG TPA: hypothetical protein VNK25_00285 [Candidatus Nitrosotenuis sp.]|nr:hypothetical protein [Candidatus Nitrosotenuis sp.]